MRLSDAIRGVPGESRQVGWESGALVTAVNTAAHTITVRTADGAVVSQVPHIGWWSPTVGERTELLTRAGQLLAIGPVGPSTLAASTTPTPPDPPAAPPAPPQVVVATVQPVQVSSLDTDTGAWQAGLTQGGTSGSWRGFVFYGDAITMARAGGTIVAATLMLRRSTTAHGVNGPANARLGTHYFTDPSTVTGSSGTILGSWRLGVDPFGVGEPLGSVATVAALQRGWGRIVALTPAQIADLNAGAAGVGFEPGTPGHDSVDNVVFAGGAMGALSLTVAF